MKSSASLTLSFLVIATAAIGSLGVDSQVALAEASPQCMLTPRAINDLATRKVKDTHAQKEYMPNNMIVRSTVDLKFSNDEDESSSADAENYENASIEGFWRPKKDDFYTLGPAPIIGVDLQRSNNLVYICANRDTNPANEKVIIYFLHGYGLRRKGAANLYEEVVDGQYLKIAPLHVDVAGIGQILHVMSRYFGKVPLFDIVITLFSNVEGDVAGALTAFTDTGVERIIFTPGSLELANGIDLDDPSKTRMKKVIQLK